MKYHFLIDSYDTERLKVLSVWSEFRDDYLNVRPKHDDPRGRSIHEHMVHQCVAADVDASDARARAAQQLRADGRYRWPDAESRTDNLRVLQPPGTA
jgi:hypothetical protein